MSAGPAETTHGAGMATRAASAARTSRAPAKRPAAPRVNARAAVKTAPKIAPKAGAKASVKPAAAKKVVAQKSAPTPVAARPVSRRTASKKPGTKRPRNGRTSAASTNRGAHGITVNYSGVTMRSKLEARWAIIFDLLGINWDYEPCHYEVGPGLGYLPDFYLPELEIWAEVKGHPFFDAESIAKVAASIAGPNPLPLRNAPYGPAGKLLLLGNLHPNPSSTPVHSVVEVYPDSPSTAQVRRAALTRTGVTTTGKPFERLDASGLKKGRRPSKQQTAKLLDPMCDGTELDPAIHEIYLFAANAHFDDNGKLSAQNEKALIHRLERRRAGRPMPVKNAWFIP